MKHLALLIALITASSPVLANDGEDLLARCIAYHDPAGDWMQSQVSLSVKGTYADGRTNLRNCTLDYQGGWFSLSTERDGVVVESGISEEGDWFKLDGRSEVSDAEKEQYNLNSERVSMMRNYMGYLWGLPMKLRDPGSHVDPVVGHRSFQGQDVLDLKITYDAEVGGDIWHIYIDPADARMVGYAFFKNEAETEGEYITLEGEMRVGEARIPKLRAWYHVSDNRFLGTDELVEATKH